MKFTAKRYFTCTVWRYFVSDHGDGFIFLIQQIKRIDGSGFHREACKQFYTKGCLHGSAEGRCETEHTFVPDNHIFRNRLSGRLSPGMEIAVCAKHPEIASKIYGTPACWHASAARSLSFMMAASNTLRNDTNHPISHEGFPNVKIDAV